MPFGKKINRFYRTVNTAMFIRIVGALSRLHAAIKPSRRGYG